MFENGPFPGDVLHVYVGLATFLTVAYLFRRKRGVTIIALVAVVVAQCGNEIGDTFYWIEIAGQPNYLDVATDTVNTLLWPPVLTIGDMLWSRRREP